MKKILLVAMVSLSVGLIQAKKPTISSELTILGGKVQVLADNISGIVHNIEKNDKAAIRNRLSNINFDLADMLEANANLAHLLKSDLY